MPDPDDRPAIEEAAGEITNLLRAWSGGDHAALDRLAEQVYPELRRMARRYMKNERHASTLQSTALVHEVYLRLVDVRKVDWRERAQFYAMAAQMMRRILVDAARARAAKKRGGSAVRVNIDDTAVLSPSPDRSILALDEALTAFSPSCAAAGQGRRIALFRRPDGGGDCRGARHLTAHRQTRLGFRQSLAVPRAEHVESGSLRPHEFGLVPPCRSALSRSA